MNQEERNIDKLNFLLEEENEKMNLQYDLHIDNNYKHPYEGSIATVEIKNAGPENILVGILPWVIPVEFDENTKLSKEQIQSYLQGIKRYTADKEQGEILTWTTNHKEENIFFQLTPWKFLTATRLDIHNRYEVYPIKGKEGYYLYSFQMIGPTQLTQSDYTIIWAMVNTPDLIASLNKKLKTILNS